MGLFINQEKLTEVRSENQGKTIVFCSGCYDILHSGHVVFFDQCKSLGDVLVVGVGSDKVVRELKGSERPVNPENNRAYLVSALETVDFAVINEEEISEGKIDFAHMFKLLKPDVFVLNDDDSGLVQKEEFCRDNNIEFKTVSRTVPEFLTPVSSTHIINRKKRNFFAPLRIDFAGGWTDIPNLMEGKTGYVSTAAINPLVEVREDELNLSVYPRGSGLSTSTGVKILETLSSDRGFKNKSLDEISESLFEDENKGLGWAIGRQDPYAIVHGGFNCWECTDNQARSVVQVDRDILDSWEKNLLLVHTGRQRNAQKIVQEVYEYFKDKTGKQSLERLASLGLDFAHNLKVKEFEKCAEIMHENWMEQKKLAPSSSDSHLDDIYKFAYSLGARGKLCGAGGGGAFVFYHSKPNDLAKSLLEKFSDCFVIDFGIEHNNIKDLNNM